MFQDKLVTVIMPVFNGGRYLKSAIESILNQTYYNFELVIINDGSTDNSLEIIQQYSRIDKRIIFVSRKNKGLVYSLNEAIKLSSGDYIARMDADDISHNERFEKQVSLLDQNPDLYLVGVNFELIFEEGVTENLKKEMLLFKKNACEPLDDTNKFQCLLEGYKILHPTWMIRKELFDYIGGYRNYASEDGEFLFRTIISGFNMDKINETLFYYRIHEMSKGAIDRKNNLYKKDNINFKLDYLERTLKKIHNSRYLIWGADLSGELAFEILNERYNKSILLAYIDSTKVGDYNGINIIKPDEIDNYSYDYIFICTRGGAKFAYNYLLQKGKYNIRDFFKIV